MLRKRTRLSTVGIVILGTAVANHPQVHAQRTGTQQSSIQTQAASRIPQSKSASAGGTKRVASKTHPYVPAKLNIGGGLADDQVVGTEQPLALGDLAEADAPFIVDNSQIADDSIYIQLSPKVIQAPPVPATTNGVSHSLLLKFGEEDLDRPPFGNASSPRGNASSSKAKTYNASTPSSREVQGPAMEIPPPRLSEFRLGPSGPASSGPITDSIDIEEAFERQEAFEGLEEGGLEEGGLQEYEEVPFDQSGILGFTESINDVFIESGESDTSLLDVDPGLPEVDPSLIEDVSISDSGVEQPGVEQQETFEDDSTNNSKDDIDSQMAVDGPQEESSDGSPNEQIDAPAQTIRNGRPIRTPLSIRELGGESSAPIDSLLDHSASDTSRSQTERQLELQQEAPIIDARKSESQSHRSEQGVDALLATKPVSIKREAANGESYEPSTALPPVVSGKQLPALNPTEAGRLARTNACLSHYLTHPESTSVRSPWAVMHALLAFGPDYELQHGNSRVNAIGWMCHNGTCRTQRIFTPKGNGFVPNVGAGVQGHEGQFLAILAQSNVPLDYPIQIGTNQFRVEDLVRYEMATCKENSELTFKLIGLSYYLDSNKQWKANDGRVWSIEKLIQQELAQPVIGAACGGTHRLMGFSFAVRQRAMQGESITGQYARANQFVKSYIDYTWKLQNPDGSFSTAWYEGRGNEPNKERKVQTTGHMLEWLMYTLPDSEINQPRVQKSIDFLLSMIYDEKEHNWPIGPRGHATRAIGLYQARYQEVLNSTPNLLAPNTRVARADNSLSIPVVEGDKAPRQTATHANNRAHQAGANAPRSAARMNLMQPNRGRSVQRR